MKRYTKKSVKDIRVNLILAIVIFSVVLTASVSMIGYATYSKGIRDRYRAVMKDVASLCLMSIDGDELKACIDLGVKSEEYEKMQMGLNIIKNTQSVEYIYAVIPLNRDETKNMKYVITGIADWEYKETSNELVSLGDLSKDEFKPKDMHYFEDIMAGKETEVYYESSSLLGDVITFLVPVKTKDGQVVCVLAIDESITEIKNNMFGYSKIVVMTSTAFLIIFLVVMLYWLKRRITDPLIFMEEQNVKAREEAEVANTAKTNFLFNMSHDIRTPMNAVIGYTSIAKKVVRDPQAVLKNLEKIEIAGNNLLELISQILDMSRIEAGKFMLEEGAADVIERAQAMSSIVAQMAQSKNITFTSDFERVKDRRILADGARMNQIILNILGNAIKYTEEGGKVEYTVKQLKCDREEYAKYEFVVEDNGIGMTEEFQKRLFDPFSREENISIDKNEGTGLGMAIVKRLVELMDGTIQVNSEPGKGTKIIVTMEFKLDKSAESKPENFGIKAEEGLMGRRILLVEDNEMNREIAKEFLETMGMVVDEAYDGMEAVERIRQTFNRGQFRAYSCVLMDVQMPRMNGYEATKAIRSLPVPKGVHLPIIAMTANAFKEDVRDALEAGMDDHIAKPIDFKKVREKLAKYVK